MVMVARPRCVTAFLSIYICYMHYGKQILQQVGGP